MTAYPTAIMELFGERKLTPARELRMDYWHLSRLLVLLTLVAWGGFLNCQRELAATDLSEARVVFLAGDYETAAATAQEAVTAGTWHEGWPRLLIELQLLRGEYPEALTTYETALQRYPSSLQLRMLGIEVYRFNNKPEQAIVEQAQIFELLQRSPSRYSGSENLVTAGRYFASRGEDAKKILELFYDRVRKNDPKYVDAYVATAELALEKQDNVVAAEAIEKGLQLDSKNPYLYFLAARAWADTAPEKAEEGIRNALTINPRHIPTLLFQVENRISGEQYQSAAELLDIVEKVNPKLPELWAYRAVLAHLKGDTPGETECRRKGLEYWSGNPAVDHLIGKQLSQKYRFAEGAKYQQSALDLAPDYLPAKFQLAQDLLRTGEDTVGWELAKSTHEEDGYNVVAYNLMTLHDAMKGFQILRRGNFVVRMEKREAAIYGEEVLKLLDEAASTLCAKYQTTIDQPVVVEIFPRQQDFAIRTFGLPGGDGFLGVCFGRVITMNSPASQGEDPANWKSVLWHEFCHAVTLAKTNNRMPRWLSEGISVYEERLKDPSWGQQMSPSFRGMILGEDLVPISQLSASFLSPKSPQHLQLAYFTSSLAVEYLIETHGLDVFNRILVDLSIGMPINETLSRYAGSLDVVDEEFMRYARAKARDYGCRFDWGRDDLPSGTDPIQWQAWLEKHPDNYWGLRGLATAWQRQGDLVQAAETLKRVLSLFPPQVVETDTVLQLAAIYREANNVAEEQKMLEILRTNESAGFAQLVRLMEVQKEQSQWAEVEITARRTLDVNPLLPIGHERFVEANEQLNQEAKNVWSLQALAQLNPVDPALLHFRSAKAWLAQDDKVRAKRAVLLALEEAPRYRAAQDLLINLNAESESFSEAEELPPESSEAVPSAAAQQKNEDDA